MSRPGFDLDFPAGGGLRRREVFPQLLALLSFTCVALLWTLPFLQYRHFFPMPMFDTEWLAFALGIAALVLLVTKEAWSHGRFPVVALAPLVLMALILAQAALGRVPYFGQAVAASYYLIWCAMLIVVGAELRRRFEFATLAAVLASALVAAGVLTATAGVIQFYHLSTVLNAYVTPRIGGVYGNLAQTNHYGDYLALALASFAYLYATGRLRAGVAALVAGALLFGLGVGSSRTVWLHLVAATLLAGIYRLRRPEPASRRLLSGMLLLVAGFAADQWLMTSHVADPTGVATSTQRVFSDGFATRIDELHIAWWTFRHAPLFGAGWGQFAWFDFEFKSAFPVEALIGVTNNAHNLVMQLLAETGLAGALPVVAAALWWAWDAWKQKITAELVWVVMLLAILAVHSMLEYPLWHSHFLGIAAVALGLGAARFLTLPLQRVGAWAAALLLIAGASNAFMLERDYRRFERFYAMESQGVRPAVLDAMGKIAARDAVLAPYVEFVMASQMSVNDQYLPQKLALNTRVMHFFPAEMVVFRQALLLALAGERQPAERLFRRAAHAYPGTLPQVRDILNRLVASYPAQLAPLLELASALMSSPPVPPR